MRFFTTKFFDVHRCQRDPEVNQIAAGEIQEMEAEKEAMARIAPEAAAAEEEGAGVQDDDEGHRSRARKRKEFLKRLRPRMPKGVKFRYVCIICDQAFANAGKFNNHLTDDHFRDKLFSR